MIVASFIFLTDFNEREFLDLVKIVQKLSVKLASAQMEQDYK